MGSGHICTASHLMGCPRLCSGEGRVVQSTLGVREAAWCSLGKCCDPHFRLGQMLMLESIRAKPELEECVQGTNLVQGCWLGREGASTSGSSAGPGTLGVNGKVHGTAGGDLGEAEPDEAEEVSGGRTEVKVLGDVWICG